MDMSELPHWHAAMSHTIGACSIPLLKRTRDLTTCMRTMLG